MPSFDGGVGFGDLNEVAFMALAFATACQMSLHAIPPLYPESSMGWAPPQLPSGLFFFESARQALQALASELKREYGRVLFVVPTYTCESVVASLMSAGADFEFVDIDAALDFNLAELQEVVSGSHHNQVVLLPTSLFGAPVRDYKAMFPSLLVVEDRAQSMLSPQSTADFQIVSMGVGKQVSTMGGGVLFSPRFALKFSGVRTVRQGFFADAIGHFLLTQGLKWLWPVVEVAKSKTVEREHAVAVVSAQVPRMVGGLKARWMGHSLQAVDTEPRKILANRYWHSLPQHLRFDIPSNMAYLRFPVRATLPLTGVSSGSMYRSVVSFSEQHRQRPSPGARALLSCSLLPTHRLVTPTHQAAYLSALLALDFRPQ